MPRRSRFDEVSDRWGRPSSLVHTIGPGRRVLRQMDDAEWDAAFTLGTMAGVCSIRAALPTRRAADGPASSPCPRFHLQREPCYCRLHGVEAALSSVTKNLSKSLAQIGELRAPGDHCDCSFTENLKDTLAADGHPTRRCHDLDRHQLRPTMRPRAGGLPEEIASITAYLASQRNCYATGATVNVDGGSDFV